MCHNDFPFRPRWILETQALSNVYQRYACGESNGRKQWLHCTDVGRNNDLFASDRPYSIYEPRVQCVLVEYPSADLVRSFFILNILKLDP